MRFREARHGILAAGFAGPGTAPGGVRAMICRARSRPRAVLPSVIVPSSAQAQAASIGTQCTSITSALSRSEEHTSELQSQSNLVCRLLLEKKKINESHTILNSRNTTYCETH